MATITCTTAGHAAGHPHTGARCRCLLFFLPPPFRGRVGVGVMNPAEEPPHPHPPPAPLGAQVRRGREEETDSISERVYQGADRRCPGTSGRSGRRASERFGLVEPV